MRKLYAYKKENTCPVQKFIDNLNGKIKAKFMFQLSYIMDERNGFVEPYAWNEVYIDGRWQIIDVSYYDVARTDESLFTTNYPRIDTTKEKTEFAKELLVPGSTAD
ncbi:MAG: hypothetical protein E7582_06380 [Ruminococcaceae bacterium]|nr:hypothetical protein [Oscillospiraceae bacterium]